MISRMVAIVVERFQKEEDAFSYAVAVALREYANAIERNEVANAAVETFQASNDCEVRVISGAFDK